MWVRVASVTYSSNGSSSSRQRAAAIQWEYTEGVALLSCSMHNEISSVRDATVCVCWVTVCSCVCVCNTREWFSVRLSYLYFVRKRRVYPEAALCIVPSSKRSIAQCVSQTRHLHSQKQCRQHHTQHISQFRSNNSNARNSQRKRRDFELVFVFLIFIYLFRWCEFSPCAFRRNSAATRIHRFVFVYLFACVSCVNFVVFIWYRAIYISKTKWH